MCTCDRLHPLSSAAEPPARLNNPFRYEPHPLCLAAAEAVREELSRHPDWQEELAQGKMLGVMVVEGGYFLAAFSGTLCGRGTLPYFVPPVFDLHDPDGHFQQEEREISLLNDRIDQLEQGELLRTARQQLDRVQAEARQTVEAARERMQTAKRLRDERRDRGETTDDMVRESQFLKAELHRAKVTGQRRVDACTTALQVVLAPIEAMRRERKRRSIALQDWLFRQFQFRNGEGETRSLPDLFEGRTPPSGAGECCGPKLLHYALTHHLRPLCMAEFWVGRSPADEVRHEGRFYPACDTKCRPILTWMLRGLDVEPDTSLYRDPELLTFRYEDAHLCVVLKPHGMLSVPGKQAGAANVRDEVRRRHPEAEGPMMVHRLDMDTSGLMVVALDSPTYLHLQRQFARHTVEKRYTAQLEHDIEGPREGVVALPLCPDPDDRPRQMVNETHGRTALTRFRVCGRRSVHLWPETGRTHQLRVHMAHSRGLNNPILGDPLYGTAADRLHLHADRLAFTHPVTGERLEFEADSTIPLQ
ncbi:MAG: RluA family pseudouridine synthase [Bacteroidaceae bacterium]|nr:RluA family pseudouridine synthase [Bacteroidaceae bacterium]